MRRDRMGAHMKESLQFGGTIFDDGPPRVSLQRSVFPHCQYCTITERGTAGAGECLEQTSAVLPGRTRAEKSECMIGLMPRIDGDRR